MRVVEADERSSIRQVNVCGTLFPDPVEAITALPSDKNVRPTLLACEPRFLELVTFLPCDLAGLVCSFPSQGEAETCHGGVGGVVHARFVFVARLMVVVLGVVGVLVESPLL